MIENLKSAYHRIEHKADIFLKIIISSKFSFVWIALIMLSGALLDHYLVPLFVEHSYEYQMHCPE